MMENNKKKQSEINPNIFYPQEIMIVSDLDQIQSLIHKDKQNIMTFLIRQEWKIIELQNLCQLNPGTIKRYLDELIAVNLIIVSRSIINRKNIKEKFYRARASRFIVKFELP